MRPIEFIPRNMDNNINFHRSFFEQRILYAVLILCCMNVIGVMTYSWFAVTIQDAVNFANIHTKILVPLILKMCATLDGLFIHTRYISHHCSSLDDSDS